MKKTVTDIQIRFADVDILGHVNNVNQQHYFDLGKSAYYIEIMGGGDMLGERGIITAGTTNSYLAQIRPHERVYVETSMEKIGEKSMTLFQRIISRDTGEVKAESRSAMVAFDFVHQVSIRVPDEWRCACQSSEIG